MIDFLRSFSSSSGKEIDLAGVFPIRAIAEDCLVNRNMDVTAGFSLRLPEFASLSDTDYRGLHDYLTQVIKRQPSGTYINFQNIYYQKPFTDQYNGTSAVQKENYRHYFDRPILRHHANMYVTYSNKTLRKVNAMESSLLRFIEYTTGNPFKDTSKVIAQYRKNISPFLSDINQSPGKAISAVRLSSEQLRAALYDYFSQDFENPCLPEQAKERSIPQMEIEDGYLRVGDKFVAVVSLTEEGSRLASSKPMSNLPRESAGGVKVPIRSALPGSLTYPLSLGLPFNHILNVGIEIIDNHVAKSMIEGGKYGLNVLGNFLEEAQRKNTESSDFIKSIAEFHYQACRVSVNVIISDPVLGNLSEKITFVKNAFNRMNDSVVYPENFDLANLFFGSAPGNFKSNYRTFLETVDQAVSYIPKETTYRHDPNGIVLVTPFGEPAVINIFNPPGANNRNGVFFGPSGTGKSVCLNYLIDQFLANQCTVFVVDVGGEGGSYKRNAAINEGVYLDSGKTSSFSFNPFLCKQDNKGNFLFEPDAEDDVLVKDFTINSIYANLAAIIKDKKILTPQTKAILKKSIRSFYKMVNEKKIQPNVTEYFEFLRKYETEILEEEYKGMIDFRAIRLLLEPFATGSYKHLLNSSKRADMRNERYIVTELKAILADEDISELIFINIINNINQMVEAGGFRYFYAVLDEVVDYLKGDFGDFIGGFFRKIRKDGGGVIATTQGVTYLDKIDPLVKASILSNCDYKFLTNHKNYQNLYGALQKDLSLTPFEMELLDSLEGDENSREIFIKIGNQAKKYRIELSPFAFGMYNTDRKDMEEIYSLHDKIGSMPAAINAYVERKYKRQKV